MCIHPVEKYPILFFTCTVTRKTLDHKVRTYKEYHSVCPSLELGLPPTHHPQASVPPPSPLFLGGGEHSLARKGLGESQFRQGAYTVVLFICTYFVPLINVTHAPQRVVKPLKTV
jgi:hypothetical protein